MSTNNIYLFQRALRLDDNLGLIECLKKSNKVYPIFCVDPRQANPQNNKYFSYFSLGFMLESLLDLNEQLKKNDSGLYILYGEPHIILRKIIKKHNISKIYLNKDYTPFAKKRLKELEDISEVIEVKDYLLFNTKSIKTGSGRAYKVYTPFMRIAEKKRVDKPIKIKSGLLKKLASKIFPEKKAWDELKKYSKFSPFYKPGGREEGLKRLELSKKTQKDYEKCRNYLSFRTSNISAYVKYGCVSIREVWYAFSFSKGLRQELIWREFFYHYYNDYPELLEWNQKVKESKVDKSAPNIVKACFNQLDKTGWLHNRGRLILANYVIHNQKKYWKDCDIMYAKRLVDFDPIVNTGNHLWVNKQPKFRWLKPKVQSEKWDRNCYDKRFGKGDYVKLYLNK